MKKISVILAVLMLVSTLALSAFAADGASFTVSSGAGKPGDTVSVTVAIKNNPGIVGMQMDLTFDASVLTVVSCTSSDTRFLPVPFDAKNYENASKITLVRAVAPLGEIPIIKDDFTIATLGFKIADTAADGVYEIKAENFSAYTYDAAATDAKQAFPYVDVTAGSAAIAVSKDGTATVPKFLASRTYANNFTDVPENAWFYTYVKTAYEYALANGTGKTTFSPDNTFTVAQALTAAANIHKAYTGKTIDTVGAANWFDPYVSYCVANGIIKEGQFAADKMNQPISRGDMAVVFANILPENEYTAIREKALSDITDDMACAAAVRKLANAGIVGGDAGTGKFRPEDGIKRSEACVIFTRIAASAMRDATK